MQRVGHYGEAARAELYLDALRVPQPLHASAGAGCRPLPPRCRRDSGGAAD
ncbi:hypothetical protein EDC50_3082 [Vulcaniibacterium tengchongense]|uniref:Uncharacterized protein n=1 Tax=Vulcaniibacterium tengchongense TaxID=1273429 RepID=A0A3N4UV96_9GAMM|nr:hypothetical protein EDC50_3082 [Vulcaniibacterium tengchongense]